MKNRHSVYISELDDTIFNLLPIEIQITAIRTELDNVKGLSNIHRFSTINQPLEQYKSAELVITQCFHCASACVAFGTPVILVDNSDRFSHASRLTSIFHTLDYLHISNEQVKDWLGSFPCHNILPNPNLSEMMRLRASSWNVIRRNQALQNTARKFGLIPMTPPYRLHIWTGKYCSI